MREEARRPAFRKKAKMRPPPARAAAGPPSSSMCGAMQVRGGESERGCACVRGRVEEVEDLLRLLARAGVGVCSERPAPRPAQSLPSLLTHTATRARAHTACCPVRARGICAGARRHRPALNEQSPRPPRRRPTRAFFSCTSAHRAVRHAPHRQAWRWPCPPDCRAGRHASSRQGPRAQGR